MPLIECSLLRDSARGFFIDFIANTSCFVLSLAPFLYLSSFGNSFTCLVVAELWRKRVGILSLFEWDADNQWMLYALIPSTVVLCTIEKRREKPCHPST